MSLKSLAVVSLRARRLLPTSLPTTPRILTPALAPRRHLTHIKVRRPIVIDEATRIAQILEYNKEMRERAGIYAEGLPFVEAIRILKAVDLDPNPILNLTVTVNVDKHTPHLRIALQLPRQVANECRVLVFADDELAKRAKAAGADIVGGTDLFPKILKGAIQFDKVVCTPDLYRPLATALGRKLGEKGLMPTVKRGTVTTDIEAAIAVSKGLTECAADKLNTMNIAIGKGHFTIDEIKQNVEAVVSAINELGVTFKRTSEAPHFIKSVVLSSTNAEPMAVTDLYEMRLLKPETDEK